MSENTKPAKKDQLLENNMGLSPIATVFKFPSTVVENTLNRWLESKGINTNSIIIRAILKDEWRDAGTLAKASHNTNLPFLVVLFKQLVDEEDYSNEGGLQSDVMKNLRYGLNNFRDFSQFHMKQNTPLNKVLCDFAGRDSVDWVLQKKARRAYTVLDSDAVMALCFKLPKNEKTDPLYLCPHRAGGLPAGAGGNARPQPCPGYGDYRRRETDLHGVYLPGGIGLPVNENQQELDGLVCQ